MMRTINNVVPTLLFHAHLPPKYWVEALHMVKHLLNISPSIILNNDTPLHKLYKKIPTYHHLHVFGCLFFPYVKSPNRLSPRSTPRVIIGYPSNHRRYWCLHLLSMKIIVSRHVVFDEIVFPFCAMTPYSASSYSFLKDHKPSFHTHETPSSPNTPKDSPLISHVTLSACNLLLSRALVSLPQLLHPSC